jgi:cobalt-zinc-cadmium efflux system membrane fusion protein
MSRSITLGLKKALFVSLSILIVSGAGGAFIMRALLPDRRDGGAAQPRQESGAVGEPAGVAALDSPPAFQFAKDQWESSSIEMAPASRGEFTKTIQLTGKISLNQDRVAHVYPMVEGSVDSVSVSLGQSVKTDDLLAVIHSREIGQGKLELYQARLKHGMAMVKDRIQSNISSNAQELIKALRNRSPIAEIEVAFRNRPMGDYRERVLAAYSNYLKSEADVTRLTSVANSGAISNKQLLLAEANRSADLATFQARIEQIEYELETAILLSAQAVKEAETQVAVSATSLRILGCNQEDVDQVDPAAQGEAISHYPIRAPFDGTVLTKDVVLHEQVRPNVLVLSIADLSTVWITADIYEEHVPLLNTLQGKSIAFRNEAWPDKKFQASVFYSGEIMDEATRTISMRAIADNQERLLKPGMFVTVELPGLPDTQALQVAATAIQEHEGKKFVFVHVQEEQFERRDVTLGDSNESSVVVLSGLNEGDSVVTQGGFVLKSRLLAELMGEE